jgi:hypothetical protein
VRAAAAVLLIACGSPPAPQEPAPVASRVGLEAKIRAQAEAIDGGPCKQSEWLTQYAGKYEGLEAEVAEDLSAEYSVKCHPIAKREPDKKVDPRTGPCSVERAKAEVPEADDFEQGELVKKCVMNRIAECQAALDHGVDAALRCWDKLGWPELPPSVTPEQVLRTRVCLQELKAVEDDVGQCASVPPGDHGACVSPYLSYSPSCPLLDPSEGWWVFQAKAHLDKQGQQIDADARKAADRDAKAAKERADKDAKAAKERADKEAALAKETARCNGKTTLDVAKKLDDDQKLVVPKDCTYDVAGRVASSNNMFVEVVDPVSGRFAHLLRTREKLEDGTVLENRAARFDGLEQAEMADGSTKALAVFKLVAITPPKQ